MTLVADLELASATHSWFYELLSDGDPPVSLEELVGPRPAWMADAACRGMGSVVNFFPLPGDDVAPARAICATCDVRGECLAYIMAAESGAPGRVGPHDREGPALAQEGEGVMSQVPQRTTLEVCLPHRPSYLTSCEA
jgi:hypothetical protein